MIEIHPTNWPIIRKRTKENIAECVESGRFWSGNGAFVTRLEDQFSNWLGAKYAIAVTNGTHALEVGLAACKLGFGDEVLVPAYTFMSSATSVLMRNAVPIPVDVDANTHCIDINHARASITSRTRAIMPVHISGNSCQMAELRELACEFDLKIIEDCAQSLGAKYENLASGDNRRFLGTIGDVGCFSFQASKLIVGGEGGMVVTNDQEIYRAALSICNYGWVPNGEPYGHFMLGSNYRMPELTAALCLDQIGYVEELSRKRINAMCDFEVRLLKLPGIRFQRRASTIDHGAFFFCMALEGLKPPNRERLIDEMVSQGIPCRRAYPSFQRTKLFQNIRSTLPHFQQISDVDYTRFSTPVADNIADCGIWFPHWIFLDLDRYQDRIFQVLSDFGYSDENF
ncbi:DegT/DnrJ/EryC1/StrS family aminotransferase [Epibacterium ulvae]|uniref:DegT/DnrJ/EryC1/StrS family aminotransferase n=1 Tax=Epibacterium ulvae TaxID=1156985 RepID=UPI00248FA8F8|nr:DegT/DnrJ/EryC1/StrS family aminotransferase [Epibacterium ulvae]